ncbi:aldo/keto reductase [Alginatibacterium sediminis]|uniref:aldo/keto reductase n=1 Tax=Alginatibacterium sediminis TaxID=2164068 RepID=UPI00131442BE|nr:aldo/keto reductase [Alginatibacterium sediminis]
MGTAMWGWSVDEAEALKILDIFYSAGGRYIDTAFNYPINTDPRKLSFSSKLISCWLRTRKVADLKVIFKFGSVDNSLGTPPNLTESYIESMYEFANNRFGGNIYSMMIHWDDRKNRSEISSTLDKLKNISSQFSFRVGLSGIKEISLYQTALVDLKLIDIDHQVKHSFLMDDVDSFSFSSCRLWAYGISGSGLKLDETEYRRDSYVKLVRPASFHSEQFRRVNVDLVREFIENSNLVDNLYEYSMLVKEKDERFFGYIVAPSSSNQMKKICEFRSRWNNCLSVNSENS